MAASQNKPPVRSSPSRAPGSPAPARPQPQPQPATRPQPAARPQPATPPQPPVQVKAEASPPDGPDEASDLEQLGAGQEHAQPAGGEASADISVPVSDVAGPIIDGIIRALIDALAKWLGLTDDELRHRVRQLVGAEQEG